MAVNNNLDSLAGGKGRESSSNPHGKLDALTRNGKDLLWKCQYYIKSSRILFKTVQICANQFNSVEKFRKG